MWDNPYCMWDNPYVGQRLCGTTPMWDNPYVGHLINSDWSKIVQTPMWDSNRYKIGKKYCFKSRHFHLFVG